MSSDDVMVSANVDRILAEARALNPCEREQLVELLKVQPPPGQSQSREDQVAEALLRRGLISRIPSKPTAADIARFRAWQPVEIKGKPLSETIIEERR